MEFILVYPGAAEQDPLGRGGISDIAVRAEQAGFAGIALTEHPIPDARWLESGGHQSLDPFVGLAFAAATTSRLRLLTYLAVAPYRNPLLLAKAATTLDRLSGGRLVLGLGTGYLEHEFRALGVEFEERNALFDETLDVLPLAWSGDTFSYRGRHFEARDVTQQPTPTQTPIPIWIGGNAGVSRRRAADHGSGWMPIVGTSERARRTRTPQVRSLSDLAQLVTEVKEAAGPRGDSMTVAVRYREPLDPTNNTDDIERHREAFAAHDAAGVTALLVESTSPTIVRHRAFVEAFGDLYIEPA